jgi:hypothetical protein
LCAGADARHFAQFEPVADSANPLASAAQNPNHSQPQPLVLSQQGLIVMPRVKQTSTIFFQQALYRSGGSR